MTRPIFTVIFGLGGGAAGIFILFLTAILFTSAVESGYPILIIPIGAIIGAIYGYIWSGKD